MKFELDPISRTGDIKHCARRTVLSARRTVLGAKCQWKITKILIFSKTTRPILIKFGTHMY
jgi:hypothetical protein